jgi:hypothetical protein
MWIGGWFVEDKWHEVRGGVDTREVKCREKSSKGGRRGRREGEQLE